jgi:hypothetical protein
VRACAAHYSMLPGRRRIGDPEAPGPGHDQLWSADQLWFTCSTLTIRIRSKTIQWVQPALRACAALHLFLLDCYKVFTCPNLPSEA